MHINKIAAMFFPVIASVSIAGCRGHSIPYERSRTLWKQEVLTELFHRLVKDGWTAPLELTPQLLLSEATKHGVVPPENLERQNLHEDGWGHEMVIITEGNKYLIRSFGPNQVDENGLGDDCTNVISQ